MDNSFRRDDNNKMAINIKPNSTAINKGFNNFYPTEKVINPFSDDDFFEREIKNNTVQEEE